MYRHRHISLLVPPQHSTHVTNDYGQGLPYPRDHSPFVPRQIGSYIEGPAKQTHQRPI
ncbi:hypothetical protein BDY21DRAFT_349267 [Lineolata rhizophorae]|uniref:Uncharacterized protein n=1 Tax=Lineolata rhizophorae TaxID=578093 RepID=A0A6A6NWZ0_9PEZI|nr:hypothetical protein BDY21DRAFT_349267 [Lineolata rhizophorae]